MMEVNLKESAKTEDEIIREVAEEEGMTEQEVREMWEAFKGQAEEYRNTKKISGVKSKANSKKAKAKRKEAKKSRKRNR